MKKRVDGSVNLTIKSVSPKFELSFLRKRKIVLTITYKFSHLKILFHCMKLINLYQTKATFIKNCTKWGKIMF